MMIEGYEVVPMNAVGYIGNRRGDERRELYAAVQDLEDGKCLMRTFDSGDECARFYNSSKQSLRRYVREHGMFANVHVSKRGNRVFFYKDDGNAR